MQIGEQLEQEPTQHLCLHPAGAKVGQGSFLACAGDGLQEQARPTKNPFPWFLLGGKDV